VSEVLTAVAMSGGLDSSVVAWLLAREGPTIGLSMLLWDANHQTAATPGAGRCCSSLDLRDAKRVAQQVGIPHYTLRMDEDFRRHVVDPFVRDYLSGRTPSPCVNCNTFLKFDLFRERARTLGAERIATGHYARILPSPDGRHELHTALDSDKDQSYYLFELTQEQLATTAFPLGERTKGEVRALAREVALAVAEKGESMEVCFVASGIREFVAEEAERHPDLLAAGVVQGEPATMVDASGTVLGLGDPFYRYTVGQRRGLGVATGERLYVLRVEPTANRVVLGDDQAALAPGLLGERVSWISGAPPASDEVTVRIRSRHAGVTGRWWSRPDGGVGVEFVEPQRGVAPGQAAVFYRGTQVLGGCWITAPLAAAPAVA
jgi:tRNA-specific 2-thiouridylase